VSRAPRPVYAAPFTPPRLRRPVYAAPFTPPRLRRPVYAWGPDRADLAFARRSGLRESGCAPMQWVDIKDRDIKDQRYNALKSGKK
jgi:hypothetical protein